MVWRRKPAAAKKSKADPAADTEKEDELEAVKKVYRHARASFLTSVPTEELEKYTDDTHSLINNH